MKLKGIGTFEQHVEKIVLGVMMVVLLAVVSLQFLYEPNRVEAGGKEIRPQEVFGHLETSVNKLRADVDDPNPSLPSIQTPSLVGELERAMSETSNLRQPQNVAFGPTIPIGGEDVGGPIAAGPIMAMPIQEPMSPTAASSWITVDPYALMDNDELAAYVSARQPYDLVGVSVESTLDGAATMAMLREGDANHRPIPSTWWRTGVAVMEVVAERQELGRDGQWSSAMPVNQIPGAFDLMEAVGMDVEPTPIELREIVQDALDSVDAIARPSYVPQIAGPDWMAPTKAIERNQQFSSMSEVDVVRAKRRLAKQAVQRLEDQLAEGPRDRTSSQRDSGGGGLISAPGGQRNPNRQNNNAERDAAREAARVASINRQIDKKLDQIQDLEDQLADLGFPVATDDDQNDQLANADEDENSEFLGNESFQFWVHDLDVVPGAVYRYRLRVKVNNPIYGKDKALNAEIGDDLDLARQPYAFSPWSAWTDPVMVGQESYLFLSKADEARRTGGGISLIGGSGASVSAEVYHMYYGHYRRGSITLEPGDMAHTEVRVGDGLYLFDTELVEKDVAYRLAGVIENDKFGRGNVRDRRPAGASPDDPQDMFIVPVDPVGRGPQQTQTPTNNRNDRRNNPEPVEPEELPEGVTEAPTKVPVTLDAMLLDVVQLPIGESGADGSSPLFYVYFETQGGVVEHRRPDQDRDTPIYEAVRASYQLGQPVDEEEDE